MLKAAATVFTVADLEASLAYYRDALGFSIDFRYGEPPFYACLCRDNVSLHLLAASATKHAPGQGGLCVFVDNVDAMHAEVAARGARVIQTPADRAYEMRDFDIEDPDGNRITYGQASGTTD